MLDTRAHSFTNRPVNLSGEFVDDHKVWTIHSMAYDNSIQSGRSALVRYEFQIPPDAKGPLSITARVNYRHLRQSYLNNVFGPDLPKSSSLRAIGNEAVVCSIQDKGGHAVERVVGPVRDQAFVISVSSSVPDDSPLTQEMRREKANLVEEQVAGFLF